MVAGDIASDIYFFIFLNKIIMEKTTKCCFIMMAAIAFALTSCNQPNNQKESTAKAVDSTAMKTAAMPKSSYDKAFDAAKIDPTHYKVIHDSLGIRILEISYKPGETSILHAHPDLAMYVIEGGMVEMTAKDGTKSTNELKKGAILVNAGTEHTPKNVGKTTMKMIMFEIDRPRPGDGKMPAFDATMDATKIEPSNYKVMKDTLGIRVLEITTKAGLSSKMHAHPDYAVYIIDGGMIEHTSKDGKKIVDNDKSGQSGISGGNEHSPKNIGKTPLKAILVEVQRPRN